nr:hypothetical protein [Tanacetum cinerariifolium]
WFVTADETEARAVSMFVRYAVFAVKLVLVRHRNIGKEFWARVKWSVWKKIRRGS